MGLLFLFLICGVSVDHIMHFKPCFMQSNILTAMESFVLSWLLFLLTHFLENYTSCHTLWQNYGSYTLFVTTLSSCLVFMFDGRKIMNGDYKGYYAKKTKKTLLSRVWRTLCALCCFLKHKCQGSKMTVISLQGKKFSEAVIAFLHQVKYCD